MSLDYGHTGTTMEIGLKLLMYISCVRLYCMSCLWDDDRGDRTRGAWRHHAWISDTNRTTTTIIYEWTKWREKSMWPSCINHNETIPRTGNSPRTTQPKLIQENIDNIQLLNQPHHITPKTTRLPPNPQIRELKPTPTQGKPRLNRVTKQGFPQISTSPRRQITTH